MSWGVGVKLYCDPQVGFVCTAVFLQVKFPVPRALPFLTLTSEYVSIFQEQATGREKSMILRPFCGKTARNLYLGCVFLCISYKS